MRTRVYTLLINNNLTDQIYVREDGKVFRWHVYHVLPARRKAAARLLNTWRKSRHLGPRPFLTHPAATVRYTRHQSTWAELFPVTYV